MKGAMAYRDLHDFLAELHRLGALHRVGAEVDPHLEIAAITDRVTKAPAGGPALLFEKVRGGAIPVATNLFGSPQRMAVALGLTTLDELQQRMDELLAPAPGEADTASRAELPRQEELAEFAPVTVEMGRCRDIVDDAVDLTAYPFLTCWPGDGKPDWPGRFITLPLVFTRDPDTGAANCGMYRVPVFDAARAGIHWHAGTGGDLHYRKYRRRQEKMPVAVAVGGDPAAIFAATLPLPEELDEMYLAGFLRRAPLPMVRCQTSDLLVPADADLVIEGVIDPAEEVSDGAFGNHSGFYQPARHVPLLRVSHVTRRRDCIYPATVVGPPPAEDCFLAKAAERFFLPLFRRRWPEIVDINFPLEWIFHNSAIVSVRDGEKGRGRELIKAMWRSELMRRARVIVLVGEDVDVQDLSRVAWRVMNGTDWRSDLIIDDDGVRQPRFPWLEGRLGIDATRRSAEVLADPATVRLVAARWREYGFR